MCLAISFIRTLTYTLHFFLSTYFINMHECLIRNPSEIQYQNLSSVNPALRHVGYPYSTYSIHILCLRNILFMIHMYKLTEEKDNGRRETHQTHTYVRCIYSYEYLNASICVCVCVHACAMASDSCIYIHTHIYNNYNYCYYYYY